MYAIYKYDKICAFPAVRFKSINRKNIFSFWYLTKKQCMHRGTGNTSGLCCKGTENSTGERKREIEIRACMTFLANHITENGQKKLPQF